MPKRIISPSTRWPGAVTFANPLTLPQALAWEKSIRIAQAHTEDATMTDINYAMLPGICACVEKWELEGLDNVTPDTFPASPRKLSIELVTWLTNEIAKIYNGKEAKADPEV